MSAWEYQSKSSFERSEDLRFCLSLASYVIAALVAGNIGGGFLVAAIVFVIVACVSFGVLFLWGTIIAMSLKDAVSYWQGLREARAIRQTETQAAKLA